MQINYPVAYLGALAAGAVVAPIPIQLNMTAADVASRVQHQHVRLLVTDSQDLPMARSALTSMPEVHLLSLDEADPKVLQINDLLANADPTFNSFNLKSETEANETCAFLNRTSGSTGSMKSVITTHAHFIAVLEATRHTVPANTDPDKDVWLSSVSLGFFINAKLHIGLNILLGIPVVLMKKQLDHTTVGIIERHRITSLFITPPSAAKIAKADAFTTDVSSIKWILTAGAPMHPELRQGVSDRFNGIRLTLEWATSETLLIAIQTDAASCVEGSSGTLVNGLEAKVLDTETGNELSENSPGEIIVRNSLARYAGYLDNDAANVDFDAAGWFHTGDYGYLDANCNVYIVDRLKELLRVGDGYGSRVSASELEAVIFEHPAVFSVVVVGIVDQATQISHPTAFVVLQPTYQSQADLGLAEEIERFAALTLQGLKRLSGGVFFVRKYPTVGFKINRRALKGFVDFSDGRIDRPRFIEAETAVC